MGIMEVATNNSGVGVSPRGPGPAPPALVSGGCPDNNSGVGVSPRRVGTTPTSPTLNSPVFAHAVAHTDPTPTPGSAHTTPTPARDPLTLTPVTHPLDFNTPSPYAILPTPEAVLGIDSSLTRNTPSSIGTNTPWSTISQHTPDTLFAPTRFNPIKLSRKPRSSARKSNSLGARNRNSRTPFDRQQSSLLFSPRVVQALNTSVLGIAPLDNSEGIQSRE